MAKKQQSDHTAFQDLKAALKARDPERLYYFFGEEMFLLRYYLEQLKKQRIDELTESFNFHRLTSETFTIQSFADAVENLPMMAEYTMVQVDDIDLYKLPEDERNKMAEILTDIPDYCCVVFTYETVAWKPDTRMRKYHDQLMKAGVPVEFAKQDQRDLVAWITRHFAAKNKRIASNLCVYLIELTGGTMTALSGEIDKICAYSGTDEIKKSDIDAVTEPVLDAAVFDMTDMLGRGQYAGALLKLDKLLKMQNDPIKILGAIGASLRRISTARVLIDNGKNTSDLSRVTGTQDYAARKAMESARSVSPEFCRKAAQLVMETDYRMKTSFDEQERLLELLILQLAQEGRNG